MTRDESVTPLAPGDRWLRRADLVTSEMDGDLVMLSVERGEYFGISGVGTRIWELLERSASLDEIAMAIERDYEIDRDTARRDCERFVAELLRQQLVTRC
jgi:hypothetical protein